MSDNGSHWSTSAAEVANLAPLNRRDVLCLILLIAIIGVVYYPVAGHQFLLYDDPLNVTENEFLRRPFEWRRVLRFWVAPYEGLYAPVAYTYYAAIVSTSEALGMIGPDGSLAAWPFHLGNLILHAGTSVLVYLLLRRLFASSLAALFAALLFALHPVQVESVAWVTEARGLLAAFFGMLALWFYVAFVQHPADRRRRWPYVLASTCFVLAMLSKPSAAAIPLMAGVLAIGLLNRPWKRCLLELAPWFLLVGLMAIATKSQQGREYMTFEIPLLPRPWIALDALGFYVQKLLIPAGLCIDYERDPQWVMNHGGALLAGVAVTTLILAAALPHRRMWLVPCGLFIAAALPTLGLIGYSFQSHSTVADRFVYLAMLGPSLAVAYLGSSISPRIAVAVAVPVLGVFGLMAHEQSLLWRNDEVLLRHTLSLSPTSLLALNNLGVYMHEQGDYEEAEKLFIRAIDAGPSYYHPYNGLGQALMKQRRYSEAINAFKEALRLEPNELGLLDSLGQAELAAGFPQQAAARFQQVLNVNNAFVEVHVHLGQAYEQLDRPDLAGQHYAFALEIDPTYDEAAQALASLERKLQAEKQP